jgi:tRNA-dihydrouridine synthase
MAACARLARELGFDGVDINMGCPDRAVEKQGAGAALIKNPRLAQELIRAAKEGAGPLPVSVKTRIGYARNQISEWIPALLEAEPAAVILHARTRNEMSKVPARWETVGEAARLARLRAADARPLILGNGDVSNVSDARLRAEETGADGVMIGRGIFGNPWLFSRAEMPDIAARLRVMIEHTRLFEELYRNGDAWGKQSRKGFDVMKKHYKAYVNGFDGAKELRVKLMEARDSGDVERIVRAAFPRV